MILVWETTLKQLNSQPALCHAHQHRDYVDLHGINPWTEKQGYTMQKRCDKTLQT